MRRRHFLAAAPAAVAAARPALAAPPATIGIMGGEIDGTFMRVATDLTSVLNSDTLRIVPVVGKGSLQNLGDLLDLPGVDLALVAADALAYARSAGLYPKRLEKIAYICKLYDNDMHVCAQARFNSLADLDGKPVNIDVEGAGTNLTARAVFGALGITPDFRAEEPTAAQARLLRGDIAANVYVAGRPVRLFANAPAGTGLHFLPIPFSPAFDPAYLPGGELTAADYPALVPAGQVIETIGVGVTLAVFNWQAGSARYRKLEAFVDAFFGKFPELLKPPHHPAWHQVNLAASQPGWTRFKPAADWLARQQQAGQGETERARFDKFLAEHGGARMTQADRDATWAYFKQQRQAEAAAR